MDIKVISNPLRLQIKLTQAFIISLSFLFKGNKAERLEHVILMLVD